MIKTALSMVLAFACAGSAFAGIKMRFYTKIGEGDDSHRIEYTQYIVPMASRLEMDLPIYVKGKKYFKKAVVITRLDKKRFWMLMPEEKGFCEYDFEDLENVGKGEKMLTPLTPNGAAPVEIKFKKMGKGGKIHGFKTEKYTFWGKDIRGYAWITKDKKLSVIGRYVDNQMAAMKDSGLLLPDYPDGTAVLKQMGSVAGMKYDMIVREIEFRKNSADLFKVPEGYKILNNDKWNRYQRNFDVQDVVMNLKGEFKEAAEDAVKDKAKDAGKGAIKNLFRL